jgi:hypothetical protein
LKHFGNIAENARDLMLGGKVFRSGLIDVGESKNLGSSLAKSSYMIRGHAAGANNGDLEAHGVKAMAEAD